jgi:hypothetical protein
MPPTPRVVQTDGNISLLLILDPRSTMTSESNTATVSQDVPVRLKDRRHGPAKKVAGQGATAWFQSFRGES